MTRLQKSRALRWLCTLAAAGALVIVLFPVYAIIVASFESTETLFSGTYYWLPHAATLDNYRTVISAQSANVLTSLLIGLGTAVLALVVAVPAAYALSKYRLRVTVFLVSALLVCQIVPSIVLATSLFIIFHWIHLVNTFPGLVIADGTYAIPFAILVLRAFFFSLPNEVMHAARVDGASEWQTFRRIVIPLGALGPDNRGGVRVLKRLGDFIFALTVLNGEGIVPITLGIYTYSRQLFDGLGRRDGLGRVRLSAGRRDAGSGPALHSKWPDGGFGGGVKMKQLVLCPLATIKEKKNTMNLTKRRRQRGLAALAAATFAVVGVSQVSASAATKITLTEEDYFNTPGQTSALALYNKQFEAAHPGVTITREYVPFASLDTKLLTQAAGHDLPNLLAVDNPFVSTMVTTGQVVPLSGFSGFSTKGYFPAIIDEGLTNGKYYSLPVAGANSIALMYNIAMLKAAHITPPATVGSAGDRRQGPDHPATFRDRIDL